MRSIHVLVIGGGASGMMAAAMAARGGARVMLLEKKNRLGKKLLATGNGKCNFTNKLQQEACYRSSRTDIAWQMIQKFDWKSSIAWFDEIGILAKERDGYFYPASGQASTVLRALERELRRLKVEIHIEETVELVDYREKNHAAGYIVRTDKGEYLAEKVILSTGGMASPVHGSTGDGYAYAKHFGHHVIPPVPALTSLVLEGNFMKAWSGVRIQGMVSLYDEKLRELCRDCGEIQMVAYGISGIPVFQLSRFAAKELSCGRRVTLHLDSMPDYDEAWIGKELKKRRAYNGEQSMGDVLEGLLPDKLAGVFLKKIGIRLEAKAAEVTDADLEGLAGLIKCMKLKIRSVSDFEKAQVTAGGVSLEEIYPETLESRFQKGLYFTGELLDMDGICGGYNLQWAWTTGYLAGTACAKAAKR